MRVSNWIAGALVSLAVVAPASAQPRGGIERDALCLTMLAAAYDDKQDANILGAMLYYLGKIEGRAPGYDYEAGLKVAAGQLAGRDLDALAKDCGGELEQRGKMLEKVGDKLASGN